MRSLLLIPALLAVMAWGTLCHPLAAQEFLPGEGDAERVDTLLNAPDPSDHAGLLGKVFMQQRYLQLSIDDPDIRQIDKTLQGFDTLVNLPVMTLDLAFPLDFDVFLGYTNAGLKGSVLSGPPLDLLVKFNGRSDTLSVGTTIYPTLCERWRPFIQIGAEFSRSDVDLVIIGPLGAFADTVVDHETELLLNGGFEFDLLDWLGYRMTFHAETSDRLQDSIVTNELILWPHERVFIRGGMATSLDQGGPGFAIGGGLAF